MLARIPTGTQRNSRKLTTQKGLNVQFGSGKGKPERRGTKRGETSGWWSVSSPDTEGRVKNSKAATVRDDKNKRDVWKK